MAANLPACPPQLKAIQQYLKLATDYDNREPVVSYWARLYALQSALKIDRKSTEAKHMLGALMTYLEQYKKDHSENEAVMVEVVGQALIENVANKLFTWADAEDRAARFNKNVVKVFFSVSLMYDVCELFGELSEEALAQRKYSKWKATYIHNCLKNGETPVSGPMHDYDEDIGWVDNNSSSVNEHNLVPSTSDFKPSNVSASYSHAMLPQPDQQQPQIVASTASLKPESSKLTPEQVVKAQKYCKWAVSALEYDDAKTAVENLQKAIDLIVTGNDSA